MSKSKLPPVEWYDEKKRMRKSAWDTPEQMSQADWEFAGIVVGLLLGDRFDALYDLMQTKPSRDLSRRFFNVSLGWPEGWHYASNRAWFISTACIGMKTHNAPKLIPLLQERGISFP